MSIRRQLTLLVVGAVCLPLAAVVGFGLVMLGLPVAGKLVAVALASLLVALVAALLVGRQILRPLVPAIRARRERQHPAVVVM